MPGTDLYGESLMNYLKKLRFRFLRWLAADVIAEEYTMLMHPEFGSAWQDGGECHGAYQQGFTDCLREVTTSLTLYPDAGGDIHVMEQVDRIVREAKPDSDDLRIATRLLNDVLYLQLGSHLHPNKQAEVVLDKIRAWLFQNGYGEDGGGRREPKP